MTDIFVDSEKLFTNIPEEMIAKQFNVLPHLDINQEAAAVAITMVTDLN
jgi:hypothetical protein